MPFEPIPFPRERLRKPYVESARVFVRRALRELMTSRAEHYKPAFVQEQVGTEPPGAEVVYVQAALVGGTSALLTVRRLAAKPRAKLAPRLAQCRLDRLRFRFRFLSHIFIHILYYFKQLQNFLFFI